nr:hypothetical protein [Providencia rettgeri]
QTSDQRYPLMPPQIMPSEGLLRCHDRYLKYDLSLLAQLRLLPTGNMKQLPNRPLIGRRYDFPQLAEDAKQQDLLQQILNNKGTICDIHMSSPYRTLS